MNEKYHDIKTSLKALFERAEEADTVSELYLIAMNSGLLVKAAMELYKANLITLIDYGCILADADKLIDFISDKKEAIIK